MSRGIGVEIGRWCTGADELCQPKALATEALYSAFINRNLRLYNAPDLREHVLNAVSIETPRGIRLSKQKTSAKIDGAVALSFAVLAAVQYGCPASITDSPIPKIISRTGFDARAWVLSGGKAR